MTLEQQVTSLDLSKRLKEMGVKQDSLFAWNWNGSEGTECDLITSDGQTSPYLFSAFTVSELGEMLPDAFGTAFINGRWIFVSGENHYLYDILSDTEANARAKMLICLIENKLINL